MVLLAYISTILTLLVYNKVYFYFFREKVIFLKYLKNFIIYTLLIYLFLFLFDKNFFKSVDNNFIQSIVLTYFMVFLVLFFNISTKSYESPTVLIYNLIKKRGDTYKNILKKLKKKKLVKIRIEDLLKQNLLIKKENKLFLTPLGKKFTHFYLFLKNFYRIKSQG